MAHQKGNDAETIIALSYFNVSSFWTVCLDRNVQKLSRFNVAMHFCLLHKTSHFLPFASRLCVSLSVTRFCEIQPLCQIFKTLWLLLRVYFLLGNILNLIEQIFMILDPFSLLLMT